MVMFDDSQKTMSTGVWLPSLLLSLLLYSTILYTGIYRFTHLISAQRRPHFVLLSLDFNKDLVNSGNSIRPLLFDHQGRY